MTGAVNCSLGMLHMNNLASASRVYSTRLQKQADAEATRVGQIDRHIAEGDYLRWAGEPFDFRNKSQV